MKKSWYVVCAAASAALVMGGCAPSAAGDAAGEEALGAVQVNLGGVDGDGGLLANIAVQNLFDSEDTYLVECHLKDHELDGQAFCDELIVLPPGIYEIIVQPVDPDCESELDHYKAIVEEGQTTEIFVEIICGDRSGGLDVVVTKEYRPVVVDIDFEFTIGGEPANKFICYDQGYVDATITVEDPDDPTCAGLTAMWSAVDDGGVDANYLIENPVQNDCEFTITIHDGPLGDYLITFSVMDGDGNETWFSFPVHIIECAP